MLTELLSGATVYVVTGYTDMRKGIDGLEQIVEGTIGKDVYSKAVYIFSVKKIEDESTCVGRRRIFAALQKAG